MKLIVNVFGITIEINGEINIKVEDNEAKIDISDVQYIKFDVALYKSMFGIAPELPEFKRNMEVKE